MFEKGDKIVYPNHGAGTIVEIKTKEILGEEKKYYIMKLPIGDMKVMIPVEKVDEIGLRDVISEEKADDILHLLKGEKSQMSQNWNRRYRANMEKLKTGDIYEVGEVVRDLTLRDEEKGLSTGEKKMLSNAKQILISELVLAKDLEKEEVENMIEDSFEANPHIIDEEAEEDNEEDKKESDDKVDQDNDDNKTDETNDENNDEEKEESDDKVDQDTDDENKEDENKDGENDGN